jgi:hypothetical protein
MKKSVVFFRVNRVSCCRSNDGLSSPNECVSRAFISGGSFAPLLLNTRSSVWSFNLSCDFCVSVLPYVCFSPSVSGRYSKKIDNVLAAPSQLSGDFRAST